MSLIYLTDDQLEKIGLTEEERQIVQHYHRVLGHREILPMVHPTETDPVTGLQLIVPTIIPPRTTKVITDVINAIRTVAGQILQANSNWCECSRQYMLLENGKVEWLKHWIDGESDPDTGKSVSKTRMEKKIDEIDRMISQMFHGDIPAQFAINAHDPPCKHCGKPRLIDQVMAFSEPGFVKNLLNIFLGGEFPLEALPLYLEYIDRTIFNEDVIPSSKKKRVMEVEAKVNLIKIKDKILAWISTRLTQLEEEFQNQGPTIPTTTQKQQDSTTNLPPNTLPDSTNITEENGDGQPKTLTDALLRPNETSTMSNT